MADTSEKILSSWLVEYVCRAAWKQFTTTSNVESRDLIQGVISLSSQKVQKQMSDVHFLILICRLSDGKNYQLLYMDQDGEQIENVQTVLESVLPTYDKFILPFVNDERVKDPNGPSLTSKEASQYRSLIKAQAVLTCCRENDFDTGQNVFSRQYKDKSVHTSFDKEWSTRLSTMLKSKNKNHRLITDNTYDQFLKRMTDFLHQFVQTRDRPVLIQFADAYHKNTRKISTALNNKVFSSSTLARASKKALEDISPSSRSLKAIRQKKIEELVKETDISHNNCGVEVHNSTTEHNESVDAMMKDSPRSPTRTPRKPIEQRIQENESRKRSLRKRSSSFVYRKNENRENRHLPVRTSTSSDGENSSSEAEDSVPKKVSHTVRENGKNANLSIRSDTGSRKKWDVAESVALYKAVQKYGVGKWTKIKEDLKTCRTNINLKDRWRTMLNSKIVDDFVERFGSYE